MKKGSKKQTLSTLQRLFPGSTLEEDSRESEYCVQIEAPTGHHWEGMEHCLPVVVDKVDLPGKPYYWGYVIEVIEGLPSPVPCIDDDCEGIQEHGECEYWTGV